MAASYNSETPLAIVTGSGSGLGVAFATQLAVRGYDLLLVELKYDSLMAIGDAIAEACSTCQIIRIAGDVASETTWKEVVNSLEGRPVSLLVNNAGILHAGDIVDSQAEDLRRVVEVNLIGNLLGCQAVVPLLSNHPLGTLPSGVINVASIFAAISPPGFTAYNASKAGVVGLSETLRGELRPKGHQVTVILPGVVPTNLFDNGSYSQEAYRDQVADYLEKAQLTAEEVVSQALEAFGQGSLEVPIGKKASWYWRLKRWMPLTLLDKVAKQTREQLK